VTVQYAPDVPGDSDDAAQRRDFGSAFAVQLPGGGTRLNLSRRPKRGPDGDFHDRFVDLEVVGASGAAETHTLIFGRGVEALFDPSRECTVTYVPPG
jgi:hypothetical protein